VRTQLDIFQRVFPLLIKNFTVYALDYPGFGWSEIVSGNDYSEPAMRKAIIEFIDALGLEGVTLAGESMGATLALTVAADLGARVSRVIAFNTYDYLPGLERANFLASFIIKSVRAPIVGPLFASLENKMILKGIIANGGVFDPKVIPADFIDELNRVGHRKGYSSAARKVYLSLPSYVRAREKYGAVKVPITLVYGDHDWSRPSDRAANEQALRSKQVALLRTGHFSSMERPEEWARIIIDG
jgi:pimeloyl-ACP methyl ester carboxylesterase